MSRRLCFALDLVNDAQKIAEYEQFHRPGGVWPEIVDEGLYIVGWVAMWRPLEIFLYDWRPIWHRYRLFAKLSRIPVVVRVT